MQDGVTGFRVCGRDVGRMVAAMESLLDTDLRLRMSRNARVYAERNRVDEPFTAILDSDSYRRRAKLLKSESGHELVTTRVELVVEEVEVSYA